MTWNCLLSLHCICGQYGPILRLFSIPHCLLCIILWQGRRLQSWEALDTSPNWLQFHPQKMFWLPIRLHTLMRLWHWPWNPGFPTQCYSSTLLYEWNCRKRWQTKVYHNISWPWNPVFLHNITVPHFIMSRTVENDDKLRIIKTFLKVILPSSSFT